MVARAGKNESSRVHRTRARALRDGLLPGRSRSPRPLQQGHAERGDDRMKRRELAIFAAVVALGGVAVWWSSHDGKRTGLPSASTAAKHAADLSEPGRSGGKSWQPAGTLPRTTGDSPTTRDIGRASEAGAPAPETEVEAAVRATFAAYNEHRQPSFLDGWTDRGFTQWFGVPKTAVGPVVVLESDLGPPS